MLAVERRKKIAEIIAKEKSVLVTELGKMFSVTEETIRRDLEKLERQGILVRTYGGATLIEEADFEMPVQLRETINAEGKHLIGKVAAGLIHSGETIFLDASTSSLHVAKNIKDKKGLTVITNSLKVIMELSECDGIHLISTGGILRNKSLSYVGRVAEKNILDHYYANKAFLSCRGVTLTRGLADSNEQEAEIKKAMMQCTECVVLLCDQSKLGKLGFPVFASLDDIDYMITDVELDNDWKETLGKKGINIVYANNME